MMRLNLKVVLTIICFTVLLLTFTFWNQCSDLQFVPKWNRKFYQDQPLIARTGIEDIDCYINEEYTIGCRLEGEEIYVPFSFIHDYFQIYGSLHSINGVARFYLSHTNSKVNYPKGVYDPHGIFMYFENYNVEARDRVKCISASEGVPITTQWESQGYFYATQIAQFGLSHYSKNLTEPEPRRKVLEDAEQNLATWEVPTDSTIKRSFDKRKSTNIVSFSTPQSMHQINSSVVLKLDHTIDLVMSVDLLFNVNTTLTVTMQNRETQKLYYIHYIVADMMISVQDENIYYGMGVNGKSSAWRHLTRDLYIDLHKGLPRKKRKMRRTEVKVLEIAFYGAGSFDNLTLATTEHMSSFYDAAEWFIRHQDPTSGGWAIPVKRKLGSGFNELARGWYSAMSQGHAISVLSRAYHHSKGDKRYLKAAIDGMKPFRVPSYQGGVLATFLGKYGWYEEYPTSPPSFVLNGFIYSLLGLYDLNSTAPAGASNEAQSLFEQGMTSLKKMLLLYDTGSGTHYDLRHFTLGIAPNLARADYHATHVNQLLLLQTIDKDPIISQTAERWKNYMYGKRAQHN